MEFHRAVFGERLDAFQSPDRCCSELRVARERRWMLYDEETSRNEQGMRDRNGSDEQSVPNFDLRSPPFGDPWRCPWTKKLLGAVAALLACISQYSMFRKAALQACL